MKRVFFISVAVLLVIFYSLDCFWANWLQKQTSEKQIWIMNKKNEKYDVAFLGNSRVFTGINADTVQKITGLRAINLGCDGSALIENYIMLKQFLAHGNEIKTLCLQIDKSGLIDMNKAYSYPFHDYLLLDKLDDENVKEAFISTKGKVKYYCWKYIPYIKYAEYNNFYSSRFFFNSNSVKETSFNLSGSRLDDIKMSEEVKNKKQNDSIINNFEINPISIQYLNKILETCHEKNIKCVLYKTPMYAPYYLRSDSGVILTEKFIKEYAIKSQCNFIDFQDTDISENFENFKDRSHLNKQGANLFSSIFGTLLKQNNDSNN